MNAERKPVDVLRAAIDRMNAKASGPTRWVQLRPHEADALLVAIAGLAEKADAAAVCLECSNSARDIRAAIALRAELAALKGAASHG